MNHSPHIMPREDYILPSMLPLGYTHRASYHDEHDNLVWRWFPSLEAAEAWLQRFVSSDEVTFLRSLRGGKVVESEVIP